MATRIRSFFILRTSLPSCDQQLLPPHWFAIAGIGAKVITATAPRAARPMAEMTRSFSWVPPLGS